ncbi:MAG: hypothetical protein IT280_12300 [Ignavibacteria bacterium]|nr:hypothetical protein [Ignavibacteria bacterium]
MKIVFIFLFCLLISAKLTFSQWEHIATIGNNDLRGVKFFNEYSGIVVGEGGIWRSTNSGNNWTNVYNFVNMNSISLLNSNLILTAGDNGTICISTNEGSTWINANTPTNNNLYSIDWANASICFCVGANGILLKSTNAGFNWFIQNSTQTEDLKGIYMSDPLNGYVSGGTSKELFGATFNGGTNWTYPLNQTGNYINSMYCFPSFDKIILVGSNGRIRRSTNFGSTWFLNTSMTSVTLNSVYFANDNTGFIVGDNGTILKSQNGGINWSTETSATSQNLYGVYFFNTTIGWAVGNNGIVLRNGIPLAMTGEETELKDYALEQNYPNPFNPMTTIKFSLPEDNYILLTISDILGNSIKTLTYGILKKGNHTVFFNGENYPSGLYFLRLEIQGKHNFSLSKKMLLIK